MLAPFTNIRKWFVVYLQNGAAYRLRNAFSSTAEEETRTSDVRQVFAELKQIAFVQAATNQLNWFKANIEHFTQHIDEQYFEHRQTLLHVASREGCLKLVCWLVEERSSNLDIVDVNLNSALHSAVYNEHSVIVEYLLDCGANPLLVNKRNMTPEQEGERHATMMRPVFKLYVNVTCSPWQ